MHYTHIRSYLFSPCRHTSSQCGRWTLDSIDRRNPRLPGFPGKAAARWSAGSVQAVVSATAVYLTYPRSSMYGIFTYIWVIYRVNVGKYTIHGWSGNSSHYKPTYNWGGTTLQIWLVHLNLPRKKTPLLLYSYDNPTDAATSSACPTLSRSSNKKKCAA